MSIKIGIKENNILANFCRSISGSRQVRPKGPMTKGPGVCGPSSAHETNGMRDEFREVFSLFFTQINHWCIDKKRHINCLNLCHRHRTRRAGWTGPPRPQTQPKAKIRPKPRLPGQQVAVTISPYSRKLKN